MIRDAVGAEKREQFIDMHRAVQALYMKVCQPKSRYADDLALCVEKRAAGTAVIDGGVCLDEPDGFFTRADRKELCTALTPPSVTVMKFLERTGFAERRAAPWGNQGRKRPGRFWPRPCKAAGA